MLPYQVFYIRAYVSRCHLLFRKHYTILFIPPPPPVNGVARRELTGSQPCCLQRLFTILHLLLQYDVLYIVKHTISLAALQRIAIENIARKRG